jgi:hypothetical protein
MIETAMSGLLMEATNIAKPQALEFAQQQHHQGDKP